MCAAAGLTPTDRGWGFLRCLDIDSQRVTLVTDDVDYMDLLMVGRKAGTLGDLEVPIRSFPIAKAGWPNDW